MRTVDNSPEGRARRRKQTRSGLWGILIASVVMLGIGVWSALPVLFGSTETGKIVGECVEHVRHGRGDSTTYRCEVELPDGSTPTVTFDNDHDDGQHVQVLMWDSTVVEKRSAELHGIIFGGLGIVLLTVGGVALYRMRPGSSERGEIPVSDASV